MIEGFMHIVNINGFPTTRGPNEPRIFHAQKMMEFPRVLIAGDFVHVETFKGQSELIKVEEVMFWGGKDFAILLKSMTDIGDGKEEMKSLEDSGWIVDVKGENEPTEPKGDDDEDR